MPEGGRGVLGRIVAAESVADRPLVSDRDVLVGEMICNGGRMDGQKLWSKYAGTSTRRLYAGASRGRTVTTWGVGTWPRISMVSPRRGGCVRCDGGGVGC